MTAFPANIVGSAINPAVIQPLPGIGDMIWHLPHIRAIAAHLGTPVTVITKSRSAADQLLSGESAVRGVVWLDRLPGSTAGQRPGVLKRAAFLRRQNFDQVYLLHHSLTLALLVRLAGIPARYGYGFGMQRLLLNRQPFLPPELLPGHPFDQATAWVAAAGMTMMDKEPALAVSDAARAAVRLRLGVPTALRVAIGIGSSEPFKQWGAERFAELIAGLRGIGCTRPVLVGGPAEAELAGQISALSASRGDDVVAAIGWPLGDVAALLAESAFYVGNDTGMLNLAAAVGLQSFGLFGGTPPLHHTSRIIPILPPGGISMVDGMARITPDAVLAVIRSAGEPIPHEA